MISTGINYNKEYLSWDRYCDVNKCAIPIIFTAEIRNKVMEKNDGRAFVQN
jgi:hypothetical protein